MNEVTMIHMVILALGAVFGVFMEKAAVCLIRRRVNLLMLYRFSGSIGKTILWAMVNALGWLILVRINGLQSNTLECMLLLSVCMVLSAVDISIKKIPNELILMTLVIGASFLVTGQPIRSQGINIFGFVLGFIIFFLPEAKRATPLSVLPAPLPIMVLSEETCSSSCLSSTPPPVMSLSMIIT